MAIPRQKAIELPLLHEIQAAGGSARPKSLYDRVASHFPGMTNEDRLVSTESGANLFTNRVQFARDALRRREELDGRQHGIWKITDKGKRRLEHEWPGKFIPEYETTARDMVKKKAPLTLANKRQQPGNMISLTPAPLPASVEAQPPAIMPSSVPAGMGNNVQEDLLERVLALTPKEFEHLVGEFLCGIGLSDIYVTGRSHDGGIDGHCAVPFLNVRVGFQAKRFTSNQSVGAQVAQQFKGSLAIAGYERGILVTTSDFTSGAVELAAGAGVPVILVNGDTLIRIMLEKGLGIKTIPVTRCEIDEDFFGGLCR